MKKIIIFSIVFAGILAISGSVFADSLSAPALYSPCCGNTYGSRNPYLYWYLVSGADYYRARINTTSGFTVWTSSIIAGTDARIWPNGVVGMVAALPDGTIAPGGTYLWQAQSCADSTCAAASGWSAGETFSINADAGLIPSIPTIVVSNPSSGSTGVVPGSMDVALLWYVVADAAYYNWRLAPSGPWRTVPLAGASETVVLAPGTTYTFFVRACAAGGCSPDDYVSFTTSGGGGPMICVSTCGLPASPTIVTSPFTLGIEDFAGAVSYRWGIGRLPDAISWWASTLSSSVSSTQFPGFTLGDGTYYWIVWAYGPGGEDDLIMSSASYRFQTAGAGGCFALSESCFDDPLNCCAPNECDTAGGTFFCIAPAGPGPPPPPPTSSIFNPLNVDNFQELLDKIIGFIFWVGLAIAPLILVIAGFLYVTSAGNTQRLGTAKQMILYTVIGLAVLLISRGLISVVKLVLE